MDILQAEIARKRKSLEPLLNGKQYFKRSILEQHERENYIQQWKDKLLLTSQIDERANDSKHAFDVVKSMLRSRNEPIRLFGETDKDCFERLREIELNEPECRGQRNDFKEAMDKVDKTYLDELLNEEKEEKVRRQISCPEPTMTYEQLASIMANHIQNDTPDPTHIHECFKIILKKWADFLNARTEEQCRLVSGRLETALFQQTLKKNQNSKTYLFWKKRTEFF